MSPAGRPPLPERANLRSAYITDKQYRHVKNAGDGNFSAGLRHLIDNDISLNGMAETSEEQMAKWERYIQREGEG